MRRPPELVDDMDPVEPVASRDQHLRIARKTHRVAGDRGDDRHAGGGAVFELEFEKRRLASVLGMTPENLSRAFRGLQPYGVIVTGTRVTIDSQPDLERFAAPDPLIDDPST